MECVSCNGYGCQSCNQSGNFALTSCPWNLIDRRTIELMQFVRMAEHHLPLAGGMLDQTKSFTDALDYVNLEQRKWEAEGS